MIITSLCLSLSLMSWWILMLNMAWESPLTLFLFNANLKREKGFSRWLLPQHYAHVPPSDISPLILVTPPPCPAVIQTGWELPQSDKWTSQNGVLPSHWCQNAGLSGRSGRLYMLVLGGSSSSCTSWLDTANDVSRRERSLSVCMCRTISKWLWLYRYTVYAVMIYRGFWGMLAAHGESTRLIWSPDVQYCNYLNRVLQNGF